MITRDERLMLKEKAENVLKFIFGDIENIQEFNSGSIYTCNRYREAYAGVVYVSKNKDNTFNISLNIDSNLDNLRVTMDSIPAYRLVIYMNNCNINTDYLINSKLLNKVKSLINNYMAMNIKEPALYMVSGVILCKVS